MHRILRATEWLLGAIEHCAYQLRLALYYRRTGIVRPDPVQDRGTASAGTIADMQPPRAAWNEFPDVLIHASESAVKNHARYQAAKCGDAEAAVRLVEETIDPAQVATLRAFLGGRKATLVSVHAFEDEGVNAIPEVFAEALANSLGLPHASGIVQANIVGHTGADGYARLARQPVFEGEVQPDADYVIVDDFVGMGGTLANLKGYIESKGGRVLAAVTLTGKPYSARLRPEPDQLSKLRAKHGQDLEDFWRERFGHGFDALTQSEARYLSRSPDADTIRNRLAEKEPARDCGLREEDPESGVTPIRARCDAGPVRGDEGPADAGPSVSRLSDAARWARAGPRPTIVRRPRSGRKPRVCRHDKRRATALSFPPFRGRRV